MTGTVWDRIFANLVAALSAINGTATVSTTVGDTSPAAGTVLKVVSVAGIVAGRPIIVNRGGAREEILIVDSIGTLLVNTRSALAYAHTLAQGDKVEMGWYNQTIHFVKSSDALKRGPDGPWPAISARALSEVPPAGSEFQGGFDVWTRGWEAVVLGVPDLAEPSDQDLDTLRESYAADVHQAIMADSTRGGFAHQTRITGTEPVEATVAENDGTSELFLAGVRVKGEIDYDHLRGNRYA